MHSLLDDWFRVLGRAVLLVIALHSASAWAAATVRDLQPTAIDLSGKAQPLYAESHALLISASRYAKGWRRLDATHDELDQVAAVLQRHGFHVRRVLDPDGAELRKAFQDFNADFGRRAKNRLLFFFSGHGYTDPAADMGYLVPVDATDPNVNERGFFRSAMAIDDVQTIAKGIVANHALFLFDSCFSGSIFATKAAVTQPDVRGGTTSERWEFLNNKASKKVRQFIAAGGPKEELPAKSVFVPLFIEALDGRGSRAGDGYITGKELGLWIEQTLPSYNQRQSPHSDVIKVPELSFGDVVFQVPGSRPPGPAPLPRNDLAAAPAVTASPSVADTRGATRRPAVGDRFRDCEDDTLCPWLRVLPPGKFLMGSPKSEPWRDDDEHPQHPVTLQQGFALMEAEVTRGQFAWFVDETKYASPQDCDWRKPVLFEQTDAHPVVCISWNDAQAYAKWLSDKTGRVYRLPSEAEWEYAARAGTQTRWWYGDDESALCKFARVGSCKGLSGTVAGKTYKPNAWGLFDMHGNAWEWVADCSHDNYQNAPTDGSEWRTSCDKVGRRVLRGGGWNYDPQNSRSAIRNYIAPDIRFNGTGFRLARTLLGP